MNCSTPGLPVHHQLTEFTQTHVDCVGDWSSDVCSSDLKGTTEDEMVGWHHRFNGHGFEQTLGDGEGQRSLVCCRSEERRVGKEWKKCQTLFFWAPKSLQMVTAAMKLKDTYSLEGKGVADNEMVGWHHRLNGHEFEQTPGDGEGQRILVCCSPQGPKSQTQLSN